MTIADILAWIGTAGFADLIALVKAIVTAIEAKGSAETLAKGAVAAVDVAADAAEDAKFP
jgi:hypothetical protein